LTFFSAPFNSCLKCLVALGMATDERICFKMFLKHKQDVIIKIVSLILCNKVYRVKVVRIVADTLGSVHTRHETPICQESTMQNNTLSL